MKTERNNEILRRYDAGTKPTLLASDYGISVPRVYQIVTAARKRSQLPVRALNALHRLDVDPTDIDAIAALRPADLRKLNNFGEGSLSALRTYLRTYGRDFGDRPQPAAARIYDVRVATVGAKPTTPEQARQRYEAAVAERTRAEQAVRDALALWTRLERAADKQGA